MNEKEKDVFVNFRPTLHDSVEANDLIPHLFILTETDVEQIRSEKGPPSRMMKLMDICQRKLSNLSDFIDALEKAKYNSLANIFKQSLHSVECGEQAPQQRLHLTENRFRHAIQYLKDIYINDCEIMKKHWSKLLTEYPEEFELDDMYIDLEIVKEGRKSKEKINSYPELFGVKNGERRHYRKIVLEGDPGMGKTTYVHKLVQSWVRNREEGSQWLNKEFQLVILIRLGDVEPGQTLQDLLPAPTESYRNALWNFVTQPQNHSKILIVLDAFDEMHKDCIYFENLMREHYLGDIYAPGITVLISTRISHSRERPVQQKDFLVRTVGFHPNIVREKFAGKITHLEHMTRNGQVSLYRNPLFVGMAASLQQIPEELFDLMENFGLTAVERYLRLKATDQKDKEIRRTILDDMWCQMKSLMGKYAFLAEQRLKTERPLMPLTCALSWFNKTELRNKLLSDINSNPEIFALCCDVGLIWPNKRKIASGELEASSTTNMMNVSFPHRLFQEYFAAFCTVQLDLLNDSRFIIETGDIQTSPFVYFLSGFSPQWRQYFLTETSNHAKLFEETLICPWIYHPDDLHDQHIFSNAQVRDIETSSPNHRKFLKALALNYGQLFSNVNHFIHVCFDEDSTTMLKHVSSSEIHFWECQLAESGSVDFQSWVTTHPLNSIAIRNNDYQLTETVLKSVFHQTSLETFAITGCNDESLSKLLSEMLWAEKKFFLVPVSLRKLQLDECDFSEDVLEALALHLRNSSLEELDVSETACIGGHVGFMQFLPKTLSSLNIGYCDLTIDAVHQLITYLSQAPALRVLKAYGNTNIGSVSEFAEALVDSSLQQVTLRGCKLSSLFISSFLDAVAKQNRSFERVEIIGSDVTDEIQVKTLKALPFMKVW